jgi:isoquinoline 1-oxidoreductase beta subunit
VDVFKIDHGVAVLATDTWAAFQGKENLKLTWDPNPNADIDTPKLRDRLKGALIDHPAPPAGAKVVEAQYELPYLAHATMEPMNAVADVRADRCDVWVGTQSPDGAAGMVASMLKLPPESVTVNVMLLGGGFGRRGNVDYVSDAVQVSKAAKVSR